MTCKVYDQHGNLICQTDNTKEARTKADAYMMSLNPDTDECPELELIVYSDTGIRKIYL